MDRKEKNQSTSFSTWLGIGAVLACAIIAALFLYRPRSFTITNADPSTSPSSTESNATQQVSDYSTSTTPLNIDAYNAKLLSIANIPTHTITVTVTSTIPGTSTIATTKVTKTVQNASQWPVKTAPYPEGGALLPFNRIIAYYGNLYSKQMGVLGEYPEDQMLAMLASTTAMWKAADPSTPAIPALDYIAVTAQASAGSDGKYRARMPSSEIDKVMTMAQKINGIVVLDVQVGLSTPEIEVPLLQNYLKQPNVELALDPEFDMHNGRRPGTVIGTMDAADINWAAQYLANLVNEYHLPPKILIIHRFTEAMVTNYKEIKPLPQVQVVMDMDGFGSQAKKIGTYTYFIASEPVQFTGFKLFYKNDNLNGSTMMTPQEVLKLSPQPSFIQYE